MITEPHTGSRDRGVLQGYNQVFSSKPGQALLCRPPAPVKSPPFGVPGKTEQSLEKEITDILELGVIQQSDTPWASPCVLVPKDGSVRYCGIVESALLSLLWMWTPCLQWTSVLPDQVGGANS